MIPPQGAGVGDPLPQPRPVPPNGNPPPPAGYPRGGPGGPAGPGGPVAANDPHRRQTPTVTGGMLELAPYEVPTDRVLELGKQLELALAQNRELVARIKDLEALGYGREQALAEATRVVEGASAEAAAARAALQAAQAQVAALQEKLRGIEREDINLFKAIIEALGKLLAEGKR
jgi:multidrug efflux pump subunit AcrA (membrane-fusion protein)